MKNGIIFILLIIPIFCLSQNKETAEKININGTILFKYIPDNMFEGFYCSLGPKIIIDSTEFDFIPSNDVNYSIIRENKDLIVDLGEPEKYLTGNLESHLCVFRTSNTKTNKLSCDSIIKAYSQNNVYDTLIYKPDLNEHMTLKISSNSIFTKSNSDTIFIAVSFTGTVIKYNDLTYGEQMDYRETTFDNEVLFDDSHGTCPFEKLDKTFIVLNKVDSLSIIKDEEIALLNLKALELKEVKIFLHE